MHCGCPFPVPTSSVLQSLHVYTNMGTRGLHSDHPDGCVLGYTSSSLTTDDIEHLHIMEIGLGNKKDRHMDKPLKNAK